MTLATNTVQPARRHFASSVVTLAFSHWRQHWFLFLMTALGMITSVIIVCTVPLLSETMTTAGLRGVLRASPESSEISLRADVGGLSTQGVEQVYPVVNQPLHRHLGSYLNNAPQFDIQTPLFDLIPPVQTKNADRVLMSIYGTSTGTAISHLTLAQGRLPQASSSRVEVAITPETALLLHLRVGSPITLNWLVLPLPDTPPPIYLTFTMHVVGIFSVKPNDAYWHGLNFLPVTSDNAPPEYTVLASTPNLLAALDSIAANHHISQVFFLKPAFITWYYHLDPSRISIDQLDDLMNRLAAAQAGIAANFSNPFMVHTPPYIRAVDLSGAVFHLPGVPGTLERFRDQLATVRIPVTILAVQILCLILLFVSTMAALLIDRQSETIALLRSRGASRPQVFCAFLAQSVGLSLIALAAGPPLAFLAVYFITQHLLPAANQDAINVISNTPMQALLGVAWYALAAAFVTIATMVFSLYRASRLDVWATNRQPAHSNRRPFWQRFNLDIVAIIIALTGYGVSVYLSSIEQLLDAQTQALVVSPLALLAPIFLLLAAVLLFLRVFPFLLQLGSGFVLRGHGAVPMLALAQMARAPRQSLRMILLLALAVAFAIFTLVFTASQAQRAYDIATYQAGADFSGDIPNSAFHYSLQQEIALYRHIHGVIDATAGYVENDTSSNNTAALPIQLQAVDPGTFAQNTLWASQDSPQSLSSLLQQLALRRKAAMQNGVIPAIIDTSTANALDLHAGASFSLYKPTEPSVIIHCTVIAEVQHIPTINSAFERGVLVDYESFAATQLQYNATYIAANHVWLRTHGDAASLANVRAALNTLGLRLDNLYDQRALTESLRNDPLSLNLVGLLAAGATAALLLALAGNLLTSWLSVRRRLTSFTVLRALGATPKQITSVLIWEQGVIYATALLLGITFGALLSVTAVPTLVLSIVPINTGVGNASSNEWYALQHSIPLHLVISAALGIAFIALVGICIVSLTMMVRVVLQPAMSQVLRLDENQSSEFLVREDAILGRSIPRQSVSQRRRRIASSSIVTLAREQLRQAWFLLLVQGIGMIAAVAIVCAVPLFSTVTSATELHNVLTATPSTSEITLDAFAQGLSTHLLQSVQQRVDPLFQQHIGIYMSQSAQLSIQSSGFTLLSPRTANSKDRVQLIGTSLEQAVPYLHLLQGRLPRGTTNDEIEMLLTPTTAQHLHVTPGSVITLLGDFFTDPREMFGGTSPSGILKLRVVGLFNLTSTNASFWHGQTFQPNNTNQALSYPLLISNAALLSALDHIATAAHADTVFSPETFELLWRYRLDPAHVAVDQVDHLISDLTILRASIANKFGNVQNDETQPNGTLSFPYLTQVNVFTPAAGSYDITTTLDQFRNRTAVIAIPTAILTLQIFVLILFFVSLVANLLVDRQADTIAILRSRGASNSQVFGSLLTQSISLGIIALVTGPFLAALIVSFVTQRIAGLAGQDATALSPGSFAQAVLTAGWYALGTVLVVIVVMFFLLRRAASMNYLAVRREAARTSRRPLWQRLHLDIVAALIALTGYVISLYLASINNLFDTRTQALISAPLALVAPVFLLIGALLLFLRLFSSLLRLGERLAGRGRGMISMLALAQMARAPRQAIRMTLLLALAIAFAIFTLVFSASQAQRISDIAAYEAGADFNGDIPLSAEHPTVQSETAKYAAIRGITSATAGFSGTGITSGTTPSIPVQIRAVDAATYAQTAIWAPRDSSQSLDSLMARLVAARQDALNNDAVPIITDAATVKALDLQVGSRFTITVDSLPYSTLNCMVIAEVQHIPTINDSNVAGSVGNTAQPGGMLLDYTSFATVYAQDIFNSHSNADPYLPINHAWLRSNGDPAALAQVRAALVTPSLRLENLYDRQLLIDTMHTDPLYLSLIIILIAGSATALLLTLVGNLLASWLSVRTRLTSFVVLRSLGATLRQVIGVLLWEQGIVYVAALIMGIAFGAVLSATAVPTLTFTSTPASGVLSSMSNDEFYIIQHIIPTQIVIPLSLGLAFVALVAVCALALGTMASVVLRPSLSQALRLNED